MGSGHYDTEPSEMLKTKYRKKSIKRLVIYSIQCLNNKWGLLEATL